jgi:hypothetical protein
MRRPAVRDGRRAHSDHALLTLGCTLLSLNRFTGLC